MSDGTGAGEAPGARNAQLERRARFVTQLARHLAANGDLREAYRLLQELYLEIDDARSAHAALVHWQRAWFRLCVLLPDDDEATAVLVTHLQQRRAVADTPAEAAELRLLLRDFPTGMARRRAAVIALAARAAFVGDEGRATRVLLATAASTLCAAGHGEGPVLSWARPDAGDRPSIRWASGA